MKMAILKGDDTTPLLKEIQSALKPGSKAHLKLRQSLAGRVERLTRDHIFNASKTRHKTANRLNAKATGYLEKTAATVESIVTGNADGLIKVNVYGSIFARVDSDVSIVPTKRKWLTIPWHPEAYGKRAKELGDLTFIKVKPDLAALLKLPVVNGKKVYPKGPAEWQLAIRYWLKKGVTLPQDRGLLPEESEYLKALEDGAEDFMQMLDRQSKNTAAKAARPA